MDRTGTVGDINGDVTDLTEAMSTFVQAEEFGDGGGGLGAKLSWGYMRWEGGCRTSVFQERSVKVDEEELEEHAVYCQFSIKRQIHLNLLHKEHLR